MLVKVREEKGDDRFENDFFSIFKVWKQFVFKEKREKTISTFFRLTTFK